MATIENSGSVIGAGHPELRSLRADLLNTLAGITAYQHPVSKPPILDSSFDTAVDDVQHVNAVSGLRALKDSVRRELEVLNKFLDDPENATRPALSTNALYLLAVWREILAAPQPVVGVWKTFNPAFSVKEPLKKSGGKVKVTGVKVDVVAAGGAQWIRINTTKNSRMLAELREIDSYCTDSDDELDMERTFRPTLAQREFDNTILRGGRALLGAALNSPVPLTGQKPQVTIRFTRLNPSPINPKEHDPRIAQTIQTLHDMGIRVHLGEPSTLPSVYVSPSPVPSPRRIVPTPRVNLDLSLLVALISDLTHAPAPSSADDAAARFVPAEKYRTWKAERIAAGKARVPSKEGLGVTHSRALADQALQEMRRGLLLEMKERLEEAGEGAEFWTTPDAKERCLRIVKKIGGLKERKRAEALFEDDPAGVEEARRVYWADSRYPAGYLPELIPVRVLASSEPPIQIVQNTKEGDGQKKTFFDIMEYTSREILADDVVSHPQTSLHHGEDKMGGKVDTEADASDGEQSDTEIQRAAVTKANPRLTAHTAQSMLWGASMRCTTLTANRTSVKALLKEMRVRSVGVEVYEEGKEVEPAALWIVEPRSLAEGMRFDYVG